MQTVDIWTCQDIKELRAYQTKLYLLISDTRHKIEFIEEEKEDINHYEQVIMSAKYLIQEVKNRVEFLTNNPINKWV